MKRKKNTSIDAPELIRLNKYISEAGIASRRKADELISEGKIKVNGTIITDLGTKVAKSDTVTVAGNPVSYYKKNVYYVLNKPKDYITTNKDELGRKKVTDLINTKERIYPIGRLDRNTTGVLLFTNDGELANRLMHPKYQIERIYIVGLDRKLNFKDAQKIASGVELDDGKTNPCEIFINPEDNSLVTIILNEGKNREIRRLFEHFDYKVKKLDRKEFAGINVRGLQRGESRTLNKKEITDLKKRVNL